MKKNSKKNNKWKLFFSFINLIAFLLFIILSVFLYKYFTKQKIKEVNKKEKILNEITQDIEIRKDNFVDLPKPKNLGKKLEEVKKEEFSTLEVSEKENNNSSKKANEKIEDTSNFELPKETSSSVPMQTKDLAKVSDTKKETTKSLVTTKVIKKEEVKPKATQVTKKITNEVKSIEKKTASKKEINKPETTVEKKIQEGRKDITETTTTIKATKKEAVIPITDSKREKEIKNEIREVEGLYIPGL